MPSKTVRLPQGDRETRKADVDKEIDKAKETTVTQGQGDSYTQRKQKYRNRGRYSEGGGFRKMKMDWGGGGVGGWGVGGLLSIPATRKMHLRYESAQQFYILSPFN